MTIRVYREALLNMPDDILEFADYLLKNKKREIEIEINGQVLTGTPSVSSNIHYIL